MMQGYPLELISYLSSCDQNKRFEIKEVKKRRSLTQNAYYWVMLNQLARALGLSDSECHKNMLREYGKAEVFSLSLSVPVDDYFKYYDILGTDYLDGEERQVIKAYKGSSRMDSTEFTHLINGLRDECEAQNIDVRTPEEIATMRYVEGT